MEKINSVLKDQEILVKQIKIILREDSQLLRILRSYLLNLTDQTIELKSQPHPRKKIHLHLKTSNQTPPLKMMMIQRNRKMESSPMSQRISQTVQKKSLARKSWIPPTKRGT